MLEMSKGGWGEAQWAKHLLSKNEDLTQFDLQNPCKNLGGGW